ncbi:apoptosis-inducing TAF9-like domain 1 family protein [Venturia nashicola]|uniref:Apoptosis-inducing TAF9-like domain 1 family protein n=1 Tax=Venturia nashicola TaxID=86259 RepID=A0A4Z1PFB5_9PEZI|nr:apoptosis-inducing TAF9-like domain 1 family protein [Venturia nashicola]TLD36547.1 apoptosis-inducing TAF9-like domain 1 family protein [Venturia nashicola]
MADADPENEERLKSALWFTIGQIVDHETLAQNHNATPQFIGALTELVWSQINTTSRDLESFAKHAKRSQINTDDVLLLARRNEGLEMLLKNFVEEQREKNGTATKGKGRAGARKT